MLMKNISIIRKGNITKYIKHKYKILELFECLSAYLEYIVLIHPDNVEKQYY